ncbi:unnamed protein product [Acanthoscelides obtectus]|uniref:Uncharacterized protein n=1 Tax=Acanthoscelides obtectus TaxID=200917 RepID=A0A9P0VN98_ACAOB|nr:unnamed protein product [Acanthoscelides obtectus]CAK1677304.1 hypothetical protein AOBTE_LOCUS31239 [Acanthoscelides obtectus]
MRLELEKEREQMRQDKKDHQQHLGGEHGVFCDPSAGAALASGWTITDSSAAMPSDHNDSNNLGVGVNKYGCVQNGDTSGSGLVPGGASFAMDNINYAAATVSSNGGDSTNQHNHHHQHHHQHQSGYSNLPDRADSLDLYTFRENCYGDDGHADHRKNFHFVQDPRFPHTFNSYPTPSASGQYATQPYSANFGEFSSAFGPYAYTQQPLDGDGFQPQATYEQQHHFNAERFSSGECAVQSNGKLESFTDMLNGRYIYPNYETESTSFTNLESSSTANCNANPGDRQDKFNGNLTNSGTSVNASTSENTEECEENFGEIIKKSIVETVSA